MRFWLLVLILAPLLSTVYAQEGAAVMRRLSIPVTSGGSPVWSPTSTHVAFSLTPLAQNHSTPASRWEVFEVSSGASVGTFHEFMVWYEDGTRFLARPNPSAPPTIFDVQSGQPVGALTEWGKDFSRQPIISSIANLEETGTLRVYDAETGALGLVLTGIEELPRYTRDSSRFLVNVPEYGLHIYDAETFELLYQLEDYFGGAWSPDGRQLFVKHMTSPDGFPVYLGPDFIWTLGEDILSQPIYNITNRPFWSADGQQVAVPSDFTQVRIYDTQTGALLHNIRGYPDGPVRIIGWEGRYLVAQSGDHASTPYMLSVWDMEQGAFIITYGGDFPSYIVAPTRITMAEFTFGLTEISLLTGEIVPRPSSNSGLVHISPDHRWGAQYSHLFETEPGVPPTLTFSRFSPPATIAVLDVDTQLRIEGWSPDSRYFVVNSATEIVIWELVQGGAG